MHKKNPVKNSSMLVEMVRIWSDVNVGKERTSCSDEFFAMQTKSSLEPTSMPAHFGFKRLKGAGFIEEDFVFFFMASLLVCFLNDEKG